MKLFPYAWAALALALALFPQIALSDATVTGTVVDCEGDPIPGVTIEWAFGLDDFVTTPLGPNGMFSVSKVCPDGLPAISYSVTIKFADGRKPVTYSGNINCDDTITVTFDPKVPPEYMQEGSQNCGPATTAVLIVWLRQLGFPGLGDGDSLSELEDALATAMNTSSTTGTDFNDIVRELDKILNAPPNQGKFKVRVPKTMYPLKTRDPIVGASVNSPYYILLKGDDVAHYVLAYGAMEKPGGGVELQVTDTGNGSRGSLTFTPNPDEGGRLEATYNSGGEDKTVWIDVAICVERLMATTESSALPGPAGTTTLTYVFRVPEGAVAPQDWHLKVSECDPTKYEVAQLPTGYKWELVQMNGMCFISVYPDPDADPPAMPIEDGDQVRIAVDSINIPIADRVINFTFSGTNDPANQPAAPESGITVASINAPDPFEPVTGIFASFEKAPNTLGAELVMGIEPLAPASDGTDPLYTIIDANTDMPLTQQFEPVFFLSDYFQDGFHQQMVINGFNAGSGLPGFDSEPVTYRMYLDDPIEWTPSSGTVVFPHLLGDCPRFTGDCPDESSIKFDSTTLGFDTPLFVWYVAGARPNPPVFTFDPIYIPEDRSYFIWTNQGVIPGQYDIQVPVTGFSWDGVDRTMDYIPRLLVRDQNQWVDTTVETPGRSTGFVQGVAFELPITFAVAYIPDPGASVEDWETMEP